MPEDHDRGAGRGRPAAAPPAATTEEADELLALDALVAFEPGDPPDGGIGADGGADAPQHALRRERFRHTLAALDASTATAPPAALRAKVLSAARSRRPAVADPAPAAVLFARQVEALAALLATVSEEDWAQRARPYAWTVHGLVAHLLVIERYTAARLGLGQDGPVEAHHLAMGAEDIAAELAGAPQATVARWQQEARRTAAAVGAADPSGLPVDLHLHGWPFGRDAGLTARAFELWTHREDIARACGRPTEPPCAEDLRTMSTFSAEALPLTLAITEPERALAPTRVVLTGPGGGTFDLVPSTAAFETLVVADVVDYCRLVARRIELDALDATIEGDVDLALALLRSASVFAV